MQNLYVSKPNLVNLKAYNGYPLIIILINYFIKLEVKLILLKDFLLLPTF